MIAKDKNPRVTLRGIRTSDAEAMCRMMNLPGVIRGTLRLPYSSLDYWQKRLAERTVEDTWIVAERDGEVVGNGAVFAKRTPRLAHTGDVVLAVADDAAGQGVGSQILSALIDSADNWLGLKRLELQVYTDNAPAIRLYKKYGFEIEGTQVKSTWRDGAFVDSFFMARLRF